MSFLRLLRFLVVVQLWVGFNYTVLRSIYYALPEYDRLLALFSYTTLLILPPILFYGYLTFIRGADYVERYELKGFVRKKLRRDRLLLETLFTLAGFLSREGGSANPYFMENLQALEKSLSLREPELTAAREAFAKGQDPAFGVRSLKIALGAIFKRRGRHVLEFVWISLVRLLRYDEEHIYDLSLAPLLNRLLMFMHLKGEVWYRIELDFAARSYVHEKARQEAGEEGETDDEYASEEQQLRRDLAILGLKIGADFAAVHEAYRRLTFECHPDRHPELDDKGREKLSRRLVVVREAYERLVRRHQAGEF